jgi:hypothetical protein
MQLVRDQPALIDHATGAVVASLGQADLDRLASELMEQARAVKTAAVATPPTAADESPQ